MNEQRPVPDKASGSLGSIVAAGIDRIYHVLIRWVGHLTRSGGNMDIDPIRLAVRRMAQQLASGYYAFLVGHLVAVNPQSINSLPPEKVLGQDPTGEIKRLDGTFHTLNLRFYLDLCAPIRASKGNSFGLG